MKIDGLTLTQRKQRDGNAAPRLLTTGEAASRIGISRQAVGWRVRSGALPATRVGKHWRIREEDAAAAPQFLTQDRDLLWKENHALRKENAAMRSRIAELLGIIATINGAQR